MYVCVKVNLWMWPDACVSALKIKDTLLPVHKKRKTSINPERAREKARGGKKVDIKELKEIEEWLEFLCAHVQVLLTERGIPCDFYVTNRKAM